MDFISWLILFFLGVVWGLSFSLAKMAAGAGGEPFGIAFWQAFVSGACLYLFNLALRKPLNFKTRHIKLILIISLLGTIIPGVLFYWAASKVDAGVLAITVSIVPLATYLFAVPLKLERAVARRIAGVVAGAIAIGLLVLPKNGLPDPAAVPWVLIACVSSFAYAAENIVLDMNRPVELSAASLVCITSLTASVILLPVALATGQFIVPDIAPGELELSILILGIISAAGYATFVYLIRRSGPVFASQTGYVVTMGGVIWGIIIFNESHTVWVWLALATMMIGIFMVNPRSFESSR